MDRYRASLIKRCPITCVKVGHVLSTIALATQHTDICMFKLLLFSFDLNCTELDPLRLPAAACGKIHCTDSSYVPIVPFCGPGALAHGHSSLHHFLFGLLQCALYELPLKFTQKLASVWNVAACIVLSTSQIVHAIPLLHQLHWLCFQGAGYHF